MRKSRWHSRDRDLNWQSRHQACVAGKPLLPCQTPMCPLCPREKGRGQRRWANGWGIHENLVTSLPLDPGAAGLRAWPVAPEDRMGNRRVRRRMILMHRLGLWTLFVRRLGQWMQHRASAAEAFWWRCHALDIVCVWDTRDSRQYGQNRARGAFHRALGVVLVGREWLPVDSGACQWVEAQSALLPGFPHELRVPTAGARKRVLPVKARRWIGRQRELREGKPPFEPLQTP